MAKLNKKGVVLWQNAIMGLRFMQAFAFEACWCFIWHDVSPRPLEMPTCLQKSTLAGACCGANCGLAYKPSELV